MIAPRFTHPEGMINDLIIKFQFDKFYKFFHLCLIPYISTRIFLSREIISKLVKKSHNTRYDDQSI